jgi:PPOX class probable F420-dependent enzyme
MDREARQGEFAELGTHEYINLITFRPDSSAVHTTVRFVVIGDFVYIQSPHATGNVRRIQATGRVLVVPSNSDGAPLGRTCLGLGRTVEGRQAEAATHALQAKYGQAHTDFLGAIAGEEQGLETIEIRPWDE